MKKITCLIFLNLLRIIIGAGSTQGPKPEGEDTPTTNPVTLINIGRTLTFQCNMSNTEDYTFHLNWTKNDVELQNSDRLKIFQLNSSLIINKAVADDEGTYKCQVLNGTVEEKVPPQTFKAIWLEVKPMPKSLSITVEEDLELECPVRGKPEPHIIWMKDERPIAEVFNATRLEYKANDEGVEKAKLVVSNVDMNNRGNYTCTITIFSKTYTTFIFVRVKGKYAPMWPFIGILVEVVVLGVVIFIFEKRRAKAEFEESDTDQGNDHVAGHRKHRR